MGLFIKAHVSIPHNKMELQNGKTVIYWKLLDPCYWPQMSHQSFGEMQSLQLPTSSTDALQSPKLLHSTFHLSNLVSNL